MLRHWGIEPIDPSEMKQERKNGNQSGGDQSQQRRVKSNKE